MSDQNQTSPPEVAVKPGGKKGLLLGFFAALVLGAGGFYATYSGLIGGNASSDTSKVKDRHAVTSSQTPGVSYIALEPLVVSLGRGAANRYLRFTAQLEVLDKNAEAVSHLSPRVLDVLNGFLRAVDSRDIENPAAMRRLRAQMLRRVQVVTGEGLVLDLLITEFVLN